MASELALEIAQIRWPKAKIHYQDWDTEQQWPMFIPSGKPLRTHKIDLVPVPEPDKDPAACLELLTYICTLRLYAQYPLSVRDMGRYDSGQWRVQIGTMQYVSVPFGESEEWVWIPAHDDWFGEGDTLQEAIARACLAALKAVREGETP